MSDVEPTLAENEIGPISRAPEPFIDLRDNTGLASDQRLSPPVDGLKRRRLFGLDFIDSTSLDSVLSSLLRRQRSADESLMETVLTPNVDIMVQLSRPEAAQSVEWRMFRHSQYCLPDGQPIVLASRFLGRALGARLTGSGLFALLWPRLVSERRAVFIVASSELIVRRLMKEYSELRSTIAPMFDADDIATTEELADSVITAALETPLEYVILGIGYPKDARIAEAILRLWPSSLGRPPAIMGLGAAASMHVGLTRRAPCWVQRIGMEWFYRFVQEPRRLFYRYFVRDVGYIKLVWRQWLENRRTGSISVGEEVPST